MPPAGIWRSVAFPLIRETNINVEQSIVRLLLPESKQWFSFAGTMRPVKEEGELAETYQSYLYKRIQEAAQALSSAGSDYTSFSQTINFSAGGASAQTVNISVNGDTTLEADPFECTRVAR